MVVWSLAARNLLVGPLQRTLVVERRSQISARKLCTSRSAPWAAAVGGFVDPTAYVTFSNAVGVFAIANAQPSHSQTVKVTPLGSHDNEFCALDRAMIFEDADGTRMLYDAGRTVRGPDDPRLGNINAVLLTHVHGDHLGDVIQPSANAGECGKPDFSVKATPKSNTVDIVVAKKAQLLVGSEMASFLAKKIGAAGGQPSQAMVVRFGASRKVGGVTVTT